jgi:hypothetical protein
MAAWGHARCTRCGPRRRESGAEVAAVTSAYRSLTRVPSAFSSAGTSATLVSRAPGQGSRAAREHAHRTEGKPGRIMIDTCDGVVAAAAVGTAALAGVRCVRAHLCGEDRTPSSLSNEPGDRTVYFLRYGTGDGRAILSPRSSHRRKVKDAACRHGRHEGRTGPRTSQGVTFAPHFDVASKT